MARRFDTSTELIFDADYLPVAQALLKKARHTIDIVAFSFAIGSAAGKLSESGAPYVLAKTLMDLKKKRPGLRIRLYIEGERDTYDRNRVTADVLSAAGIEVVYGATHAKGFCVDARYVLFGSTNLSNQSMTKNEEANVLVDDPSVAAQFLRYFEHLWEGGRHDGVELEAPMLADSAFEAATLDLIRSAKKRIEFSMYFFDHAGISKALIAAHERGVAVRGFVHRHFSFAISYVRRNERTVRHLGEAGLDDIHFSNGSRFSHSKYIVRDRTEFVLGTGNWLVEDVETHPQLAIRMTDRELAKQLAGHLTKQIAEHSVTSRGDSKGRSRVRTSRP